AIPRRDHNVWAAGNIKPQDVVPGASGGGCVSWPVRHPPRSPQVTPEGAADGSPGRARANFFTPSTRLPATPAGARGRAPARLITPGIEHAIASPQGRAHTPKSLIGGGRPAIIHSNVCLAQPFDRHYRWPVQEGDRPSR